MKFNPVLKFIRGVSTSKIITSNVVEETLLHPRLKTAFQRSVGPTLTPVQEKCIDEFIQSSNGIVVRAKTGTGKTFAFGVPLLHSVLETPQRGYVDSVVFAPTRDLALQTQVALDKLYKECLNKKPRSDSLIPLVIGQVPYGPIMSHFNRSVSPLVVASPGRFLDMLKNQPRFRDKFVRLNNIVIDEADELLRGNFKEDIQEIIDELNELNEVKPPKTMLFSATINDDVFQLAEQAIGKEFPFIDVTGAKKEEVNKNITQTLVKTSSLASSYVGAVERLISKAKEENHFKAIVFLSTTSAVDFFSNLLSKALIQSGERTPVLTFHGKLSQSRRDNAQAKFRKASRGILVASGIGARGMDFPNVSTVVQIGVSSEIDQHTHKIGRTGRNGTKGQAILFANQYEMPFVRALEKNNNEFQTEELNEEDAEFKEMESTVESITQRMGREYIHDTIYGFLGNYRNVPPKVAKFNMTALAKDNAHMFNKFAGAPIDEFDEPLKLKMSYKTANEMRIDFDELDNEIEFTGIKPRQKQGQNQSRRSGGGFRGGNNGGRNYKRENNWNDGNDRGYNRNEGGYRNRSSNGNGNGNGNRRSNNRRNDDNDRYSRW